MLCMLLTEHNNCLVTICKLPLGHLQNGLMTPRPPFGADRTPSHWLSALTIGMNTEELFKTRAFKENTLVPNSPSPTAIGRWRRVWPRLSHRWAGPGGWNVFLHRLGLREPEAVNGLGPCPRSTP